MANKGRTPRALALACVLILLGSGFGAMAAVGVGERNPGLDVSAISITSQKDLDEPSGGILYPTGPTSVQVAVKNTGDVNSPDFLVKMEVGKSTAAPKTVFYADAEGGSLPAGWSVQNFTLGKWHTTNRTYSSASNSAWCGPEGQAGNQYSTNWEEEMVTTNAIAVPASNPLLLFNHLFLTKFATDGGFLQVGDTSTGVWDSAGPTSWQFTQGNYNTTTASINPINKDTPCFGGDSGGWQSIAISLSNYASKSIRLRFVFSSSSAINGDLVGWYIDDVRVTDGATTTFSDSFESGMAMWTVTNLMGAVPTAWAPLAEPSPSYNISSTRCFSNMETVVNNTYFNGEDSALVTSDIPLSGETHARLHFWYKMATQTGYDGGFVEAQKAGGEWTYLRPVGHNYPSLIDTNSPYGGAAAFNTTELGNTWVRAVFDLSAFTGGTARVRFHFYANFDDTQAKGWSIDEVSVVAWKFDPAASDVRSIQALSPAKIDNATFSFNLSQEGFYVLAATTQLPGDTRPANNRTFIIIEVRNVLTVDIQILASPNVPVVHGRTVDIPVTVTNTGNMINQVELKNSALPAGISVAYNRTTTVNISAGNKLDFTLSVTAALDMPNGLYGFSLNATSRTDPARYSERPVSIEVQNNQPTAVAQAQPTGLVFTPVAFDGTRSTDPDLDQLNYDWDFGDGTSGSGNLTNHSYGSAGRYTVTLNVSDGGPGSFNTNLTSVNISDKEPVALFDIDTPINNGTYQKGTEVVFNASRSRDESPARLNFTWDFGDNSEYGYGVAIAHVFSSGGLFTVTLAVSDPGGQYNSYAKDVLINNPPSANISSPADNQTYYTTDDILFSSTGSFDPDDNPLTFRWEDNQLPGQVLSTSPSFSKLLSVTGRHVITLTVFDGKGPVSYSYDQVTVEVAERQNQNPTLTNGAVDPPLADEGTLFRYTVTYADPNNDVPEYVQVIIDGRGDAPSPLLAADLDDINFADGKNYYFCTTALRGEDSPHSFLFITADKHGSGRISTEVFTGPMVKWVRDIGKDSPDQAKLRGKVYQTGPYRTILSLVNNVTPPDVPAGRLPLGLVFTMNTTAPAERWYWANITVLYSAFDFSKLNESTLKIFWSVDGGPWTVVPDSGQEMDGQVLWMRVTRSSARFAVFGVPLPTGPVGPGKTNETKRDDTWLYIGIAVTAGIVLFVVAAVYLRRKPAVPPEPDLQRVEDVPAGRPTERKWARNEAVARPEAMVGTTGEEVKVFRPAGGEVKVFRPGGDEKIFKPAQNGEQERIFRPGASDVVQEEAREPPVVDEDAPREKVVEYREGSEEEEPSMPGARPAEKEVEDSEESETGTDPAGKGAPGEGAPAPKKPEDGDESLDDLLEDLDK